VKLCLLHLKEFVLDMCVLTLGISGVDHRRIFWYICKATTMNQHEKVITLLRRCDEGAYWYLQGKHPDLRSRAFYNCLSTCVVVDNNMCEVFNVVILDSRHKPILTMFEEIREMVLLRLKKKRDEIKKQPDHICPRIQA